MNLEDNMMDLKKVSDLLQFPAVAHDFVVSICGSFIGSGSYRTVYEYNPDPRFVVKIEPMNTYRNFTEWKLWQEIKGLRGSLEWVKDWYAPCGWISPNGRILIMKRTSVQVNRKKPEKVPVFLFDVKENNFGWIGSNFVCHDYGENFYAGREYKKKFKKPIWV